MKFVVETQDRDDVRADTLFDILSAKSSALISVELLPELDAAAQGVALEALQAASKCIQEDRPDEARSYVNTAYSALRLTRGTP